MEAIVQRIRVAMNLILITSLVLLLGLSAKRADITKLATRIVMNSGSLLKSQVFQDALQELAEPERQEIITKLKGIANYGESGDSEPPAITPLAIRLTRVEGITELRPDIDISVYQYLMAQAIEALSPAQFDTEMAQIMANFEKVKITGALGDLASLETNLSELQNIYEGSGLGSNATVRDLIRKRKEMESVHVPVINVKLGIVKALRLFELGAFILMVYLSSCITTLQSIVKSRKPEEIDKGIDWLFLHRPGLLGPILGSLWLLAPCTVAAVAKKTGVGNASEAIFWAILFAASAITLIVLSAIVRQAALRQKNVGENESEELNEQA